jgi:predicted porin
LSLEPSADGRMTYTDNISMNPNTKDSVWGYQVAPKAVLSWREELSEIAGEARLGLNRYPSRSELNTTDYLAALRMSASSERNGYGLSASFIRDSTLASEARQTGIVHLRRQRSQLSLAPSYQRVLTERTSASVQYAFGDVGYESGTGLRDSQDHQVSAGYAYALSARLKWDASLSWSKFKTKDHAVRSDTNGANLGMTYALSERASLGLGAGWRRTQTNIVSNFLVCPLGSQFLCEVFGVAPVTVTQSFSTRESSLVLNASSDFQLESGRLSFRASRGTFPTASGLTVSTDRIGFEWRAELSQRLSATLSSSWLRSVYDGNLGPASRYFSIEPSLSWKLAERLTLGTGYSYAYSNTDNSPASARANTAYVALSYQWPPVSLR